jgi:hypothetical protein
MTDSTPEYVWEISGPCREHDSYILPHGNDEARWVSATDFALAWLEELMDQMQVGGPTLGIEVQFRDATESDLAILLGESDELDD